MIDTTLIIRDLGQQDYLHCWQSMKEFTDTRTEETIDEIWLVEHNPVFTQGQNGKPEHVLQTSDIPIVQTDRGGQITYHGPGQLMAYTLLDIKRKKLNIRQLVTALETSVIEFLASKNIAAIAKCDAPGVYVDNKKICSVGLRIRRGCSYHGLALNVEMDLKPFAQINPCGFKELQMTQLSELLLTSSTNEYSILSDTKLKLAEYLTANLGYTNALIKTE